MLQLLFHLTAQSSPVFYALINLILFLFVALFFYLFVLICLLDYLFIFLIHLSLYLFVSLYFSSVNFY